MIRARVRIFFFYLSLIQWFSKPHTSKGSYFAAAIAAFID